MPSPASLTDNLAPDQLVLSAGSVVTALELKSTLGSTRMTRADEPAKWTYQQAGGDWRYEYADIYLDLTTVQDAPQYSIIELFLRPVPPGSTTPTAQNSDRAQNGLIAEVNLYPGDKNHRILLPRVLTYRGKYVIDMRSFGVTIGIGSSVKIRPITSAVGG